MAWLCSGSSNTEMVEKLCEAGIVTSPIVRESMLATDRAHFCVQSTPKKAKAKKESSSYAYGPYADAPQAIGNKVTISAPHIHATALQALSDVVTKPGSRVLDVGSGSGVLVACFARMAGPGSKIIGVEVVANLVPISIDNLTRNGLRVGVVSGAESGSGTQTEDVQISIRHGDGWAGSPQDGPFDAIHVGASASSIPPALLAQLKPGGRLIMPLGDPNHQQMMAIERRLHKTSDNSDSMPFVEKVINIIGSRSVRFVPLIDTMKHPAPAARFGIHGSEKNLRLSSMSSCPNSVESTSRNKTGAVNWDQRYKRGWAYGKQPNDFLAEIASMYFPSTAAARRTAGPFRVLSLGEGQGRNAVFLAALQLRNNSSEVVLGDDIADSNASTYVECTGVDSSAVGLAKALRLAEANGVAGRVRTIVADLNTWKPKEADIFVESNSSCSTRSNCAQTGYDAIVSIFCSLAAPSRRSLHAACIAALRPGGLIIVECFAPGQALLRGKRALGPPPKQLVAVKDLLEDFDCLKGVDEDGNIVTEHDGDFDVLVAREVVRSLEEGRFHHGTAYVTQFVARKKYHVKINLKAELKIVETDEEKEPKVTSYEKSMDEVFQEAALAGPILDATAQDITESPDGTRSHAFTAAAVSTATAAIDKIFKRESTTQPNTAQMSDPFISCAAASIHIACATAERDDRCRYCWAARSECICTLQREHAKTTSPSHDKVTAGIHEMAFTDANSSLTSMISTGSDSKVPDCYPNESSERNEISSKCRRRAIRWVIVSHPGEFLRSNSSAKVFVQGLQCDGGYGDDLMTAELLVYGAECHSKRLSEVLNDDGDTCILFPEDTGDGTAEVGERSVLPCISVAEAIRIHSAEQSVNKMPHQEGHPQCLNALTVLVPDGSWQCARALLREIRVQEKSLGERANKAVKPDTSMTAIATNNDSNEPLQEGIKSTREKRPLRCVKLSEELVASHVSPLIEALKAGKGHGRISTFEACALFLYEAPGWRSYAQTFLRRALQPLVMRVREQQRPLISEVTGNPKNIGISRVKTLALALQRVTLSSPPVAEGQQKPNIRVPLGLRRCSLCGENLATPSRMQTHLSGIRHCKRVAARYLSTVTREAHDKLNDAIRVESQEAVWWDEVARIFEEHSTRVLEMRPPEPPDVALMLLTNALHSRKLEEERRKLHESRLTKGEISLLNAPKPTVSGELPIILRQENILNFDTQKHDIRNSVVNLLAKHECTLAIGQFSSNRSDNEFDECEKVEQLELFKCKADIFRDFKARQMLYNIVKSDVGFLKAYEDLIEKVILPFLHAQLINAIGKGEIRDTDFGMSTAQKRSTFFYQYPPSLRIQPGSSKAFTRTHRDAEYGHQPGEVNFWMPLTSYENVASLDKQYCSESSTYGQATDESSFPIHPLPTLWIESKPGAGDFHPLDADYGNIAVFHGALCRHRVPPNETRMTRISMDFRVGILPYYDPTWKLKGVKAQHAYRKVQYPPYSPVE